MKQQLNFQIIVNEPLAGVTYAVQRGRSELLLPIDSSQKRLKFEFPLTLADIKADPPRLTGAYAQGPANRRFVYVNSGTMAGQKGTPWTRRAKVPLYGISRRLLEQATSGEGILEAQIDGIGRDGGPACATVSLTRQWSIGADGQCGGGDQPMI